MKKIFILVLLAFATISLFSVDVGQKAPGLMVSQWIKNGPIELYAKKGAKNVLRADYYVVFFFATWANVSQNVIDFVDGQTEVFKDANVKFIGISSENAQRVKAYFDKYPNTKMFIGVDDRSKTSNEYLGGEDSIPKFFVFDKSKKLIWKGGPLEVNRALLNIVGGTFDAQKQQEIEKLHEDIRTSVQSLDREEQLKKAEEIYKLDPTDRVAMDYKIDDLIRKDKIDECVELIHQSRKSAGSNNYIQFYLYNTELEIVMGLMNEKGRKYISDLAKNYYNTFQNSPAALNSMAFRLIQIVPFQITSLDQAILMSTQAAKLEKEISPDSNDMGIYLQTEARCHYFIGKLDDAIESQKEAINCLKDKKEKDVATLALEYYQEAKALSE